MHLKLVLALLAASLQHGARLFDGREALTGRLIGHDEPMPATATVCLNCHQGTQPIGPPLNKASLTHAQPRRGGPPSRYTEATFCQVLRTGIDPASVVLHQEMPHYAIREDQCASLWRYLTDGQ